MYIEIKKITSAITPVTKTMPAIIPAVSPILLLSDAVLVVEVGNSVLEVEVGNSIIRINND